MAKSNGVLNIASGQIDAVLKPILTLVIVVVIIFLAKKLIEQWKLRNVGKASGAKDGSNLATDVYLLDSVWVTPNQIDKVCASLMALTDAQLKQVYNKFKTLYGEKCPGGGVFCDDTTTMKVFLSEQSCHIAGCLNRDAIVNRLSALGL